MEVYKETIKEAKAQAVKVKFEESKIENEKLSAEAPLAAAEDNTITTSSTDSEISGRIPNPMRKLKKALNN